MNRLFDIASCRAALLQLAALVLAMMCSCQSIQAPPGYIASGTDAAGRIEFPRGQSVEANYALLRWYVDGQEDVTDPLASAALAVAGNSAVEYANELRLSLFVRLQNAYPEVVSLRREDGSIAVDGLALARRSDWEAMEKMLDAVETQVVTPHWVTVPVEEAVRFLERDQRREMVTGFQLWCVGHSRLQLPAMPDADELLQQLKDIREALRQKKALLSVMASAEAKLDHAATAAEARRILLAAEEEFPALDATLAAIGDEETAAAFRRALDEAPRRWVEVTLRELEARLVSDEPLNEIETLMSEDLPQWAEVGAFGDGDETEERCHAMVRKMLGRREKEILGQMEVMRSRLDYWGAALLLEEARRRYVVPGVPGTACYSFFNGGEFAARLGEKLGDSFMKMLPDAFHFYQVAQDAALNVDNRFALVLSYDECCRRVAAAMEGRIGGPSRLPDAVREALGRSYANAGRARQLLGRLGHPRAILVEAESSEISDALCGELSGRLESTGLACFFQAGTASSSPETADALRLKVKEVHEGCAARDGMPQESVNDRTVPGGGVTVTVRSVRNVLESEVRVSAQAEQGGKALFSLDGNSCCVQDIVRESVVGASGQKALPKDFLRNDREWTEQELLESTRVQAVKSLVEKLLDNLRASAPEELAAQAEELARQGRLLDAADRLSEARLLAGLFPQPREDFRADAMKRIAALLAEAFAKEKQKQDR